MFIHPVLTWGFFLALVPLLIHLINLVRRRRVRWAAMDFLLQSYKKHQKWIWLQQMLLLALRILAVVAIVAMLAQWVARSQWLALFGGQVTHHYVLLDDSFSMSERLGGASAFDRARQVLSRMAAQSIAQESPQKMTLIRFSRALGFRKDDVSTEIGQLADLNAEPIDARFDALLEERQRGIEVTQLGVGSRPAWALALELLRQSPDETNIVHVLSDFRHKEWGNPTELKQLIGEVDRITNQIQFVHCAPEKQQSNLAIVDLRPANDIRAAGVPMRMTLTVANHGTETARRVPVRVRTTFYDPQVEAASAAGRLKGQVEEPPAVLIEELAPGQTTTRNVQVFFPSAGEHVVEASLPDDVVGVDNRRWCVVPVENRESILVVDGDAEQRNLFFLSAAFEPGPRAPTGVRVDGQPPAFLRDAAPAALDAYHAIYLLNVPTLDDRAIENLES
ncbi:MAG: BatA domain-containing protein, partial [Pirellulaceae bacterium]